jgi:putative O-methyltransferase
MASFDVVNYSLRPNKLIQRSIVFEGVRLLREHLDMKGMYYVGLGSIWFTDFQMAHRLLNIRNMISIESSEIGYRRARFNQPYKTVRVHRGLTSEVLPKLFAQSRRIRHPWLIWLDYDKPLDEAKKDDIRYVIENAPPNSVFLTTFPSTGSGYGRPSHRPERLRSLLGSVVPDDLPKDSCSDDHMPEILLEYVGRYMTAVAAGAARPGGFITAFRIAYRDGKPMVTVGGVLPSKGAVPAARAAILSRAWPAIVKEPIAIVPLTLKEAVAMQAELPRAGRLTRKTLRRLGFDLEEDNLPTFEKYYRYYPLFAQVVT